MTTESAVTPALERVQSGHGRGEPRPPVVQVEGLVKRFGDRPPVLDGVTLAIDPGSIVAVIGANGTGKSTLIRSLVRLVEPSAGRITVLGEDVRSLNGSGLRRLRARVGFVFQRHNLVPRLSALTNVLHGALGRGVGVRAWHQALAPRALRAEGLACLERVGLAELALQRVDTLSGGQSQRVAVARMLMQKPSLVIADEPDASLDPKAGAEVMATLAELTRADRATLIFVSHRMEHAIRFSDRVVGLAHGMVALDKPAARCDEVELKAFFHEEPAA